MRSISEKDVQRKGCRILLRGVILSGCLVLSACGAEQQESREEAPPEGIVVGTQTVAMGSMARVERSQGRVSTYQFPMVAAEVAGRVVEVNADVGDEVAKGDILARLEREPAELSLGQASADEQRMQANLEQLRRERERLLPLLDESLASRSQVEDLEAAIEAAEAELETIRFRKRQAQRDLNNTAIRSPFAGRVDQRLISTGGYLALGDDAFRIAPSAAYRVELPFPQHLSDELTRGLPVRLFVGDAPSQTVRAEISRTRPSVDADSRSFRITVAFDNPHDWPLGRTIVGEVIIDEREVVRVPRVALVQRKSGFVVYERDGDRVIERPVEPGLQSTDWVEIRSGLEAGVEVVTDGAGYLSDGARIRTGDGDA